MGYHSDERKGEEMEKLIPSSGEIQEVKLFDAALHILALAPCYPERCETVAGWLKQERDRSPYDPDEKTEADLHENLIRFFEAMAQESK